MKLHEQHKKIYDRRYWGEELFRDDLQRAKTISLNRLLSRVKPVNPSRFRIRKTKASS